ncbi:MAG: portal protein [Bacillota bacterium]
MIKLETQHNAVNHVSKLLQSVETNRQQRIIRYNKARNLYLNKIENPYYQRRGRINLPIILESIQILLPYLMQLILRYDWFSLTKGGDIDEITRKNEDLIKAQLRGGGFRQVFKQTMLDLLIQGTAVGRIFWNYDENARIDRPQLERVNPLDFFIDPTANSIDEATWVAERKNVAVDNLDPSIYFNLDTVKGIAVMEAKDEYNQTRNEITLPTKNIDIVEFRGLYSPKEGIKPKFYNITVAGDMQQKHTLIRFEEMVFPFLPYVGVSYMEDLDDNFFGLSLPKITESLAMELSAKRQQTIDLMTRILRHQWLRNRNANIDKSQLNDEPNQVIDTDDMAGIIPLVPSIAGLQVGLLDSENVKEDIRSLTGATRALAGKPLGQRATLGEAQQDLAQGENRLIILQTKIEDEFLEPLVRKFLALNRKYLFTEQVLDTRNGIYETIKPNEILNFPNIIINIGTLKTVSDQRRLLELHQLLISDPNAASLINMREFYRRLLESLNIRDIDELLNLSPEQAQQQLALATLKQNNQQMPIGMQKAREEMGGGAFPQSAVDFNSMYSR